MDNATKSMLASLYMANSQTKEGYEGIVTAFKTLASTGTENEKRTLLTISHNYKEVVRLLDVIQKELKPLV